MTKPVPTLQLHCIFENIHTWANRVLRPCISHYIDQWLARHPSQSPNSPPFRAINSGNQFTPTRQADQGSQHRLDQDMIGGEASPYFFKDLFNDRQECSEAIHQTESSQGGQSTRGSSPSPSIGNTMSYLEQIVDNYRDEDDSDYFPDSGDDSESDDSFEDYSESEDSFEDDSESDDGSEGNSENNESSYASINSDIDGNEQSQYVSGRRLSDPFNDNEQNPANSDLWEDYDGSTSCGPNEIEDSHEALPTLYRDECYQDQESIKSHDSGNDYGSPPPRPRTTSPLPTTLLPKTPTRTWAAPSIDGINIDFQLPKSIANTVPTRSSKGVDINPSVPSNQTTSALGPPNAQRSQVVPSIPSCMWVKKRVQLRKKIILIRFPCFIASDSSINLSHQITKRIIIESPKNPEATSIESSEYLFFGRTILEPTVPLVRLPKVSLPVF